MKALIVLLIAVASCESYAMGDIERGLIFIGNAASGGTYLASLESERAQITLNHEKQKAAYRLQAERNYQGRLRQFLQEQLNALEINSQRLAGLLNEARKQQQSIAIVNTLLEQLYAQKISLSEFKEQLQIRAATMKSIGVNWNEIIKEGELDIADSEISDQEVNALLLTAFDREAQYSSFIIELESDLAANFIEIDAYKKRIGDVP